MIKALFYLSFSLMVAFLLAGCAVSGSRSIPWHDEAVDLVWPGAPDQPRVRYLRSLSGPADFKEKGRVSEVMSWMLGEDEEELSFNSPFSVAVSRTGSVWVADTVAHILHRLDMNRGEIDYFYSFSGQDLVSPSGVAVDDERKRVYLADASLKKVFVLDADGHYLGSWEPPGGFGRPAGLALDPSGRLLVADVAGGVVHIFNPDGAPASQVLSKVNSDGRFNRPLNVAVGPQGEILVLDSFSFRVEVQSAQGELLGTIGQLGDAAGYMARPKGLAVDKNGYVYVSDSAFDNIQVFDMAGNLLMFWGAAGREPGRFNLPAGLFIDEEKRLFVADSYNHRVQVFQLLQ